MTTTHALVLQQRELAPGTTELRFHPTLPVPGQYRVFADAAPTGGQPTTVAADLLVTGEAQPRPLPEPSRISTVGAYEVVLDGELKPGTHSPLTLTVRRDGQPVTDLPRTHRTSLRRPTSPPSRWVRRRATGSARHR